jgi:hypothetical protein
MYDSAFNTPQAPAPIPMRQPRSTLRGRDQMNFTYGWIFT